MSGSWDRMRKAKEDSYFEKKNQEALERLRRQSQEEEARLPNEAAGSGGEGELLEAEIEVLTDDNDRDSESRGWLTGVLRRFRV